MNITHDNLPEEFAIPLCFLCISVKDMMNILSSFILHDTRLLKVYSAMTLSSLKLIKFLFLTTLVGIWFTIFREDVFVRLTNSVPERIWSLHQRNLF